MVENVLYLGWKPILLSFILNTFVAFKKTRPRHHSWGIVKRWATIHLSHPVVKSGNDIAERNFASLVFDARRWRGRRTEESNESRNEQFLGGRQRTFNRRCFYPILIMNAETAPPQNVPQLSEVVLVLIPTKVSHHSKWVTSSFSYLDYDNSIRSSCGACNSFPFCGANWK